MIKEIRVCLEYNTFPVWLYDEIGEIIDNDLPPEWENDKELEDAFMTLSDCYDTFFVDMSNEFRYVGCGSDTEKQHFCTLANNALSLLNERNDGKYVIVDDISKDELLQP